MYDKTILIVDDEPRAREGVKNMIERWTKRNLNLLTAENGNQALRIVEEQKVDILLTDIQMTEITGLQIIKKMRERGQLPVAIIISAYPDFEYAREAIAIGVVNYLLKPINRHILLETIEDAIQLVEKRERAGVIEKVVDNKLVSTVNRNMHASEPIRAAIEYINKELKNDITLTDVAAFVHLNSSYLSVLFKEQMNLTFSEYLTRRRIQRAKELLLTTKLTISEISEECGYKTTKYFIKIFKDLENVTPNQYRKK